MSVFLMVILCGCSSDHTTAALFYPVDSLLNMQAETLAAARASITKTASLGEKTSTESYSPADSAAWRKELDIFGQISSINKPVNHNSYSVSTGKDSRSNLLVTTYHSTEEVPVEYLKVYYYNKPSALKKIEAKVREENSMYEGSRILRIQFSERDGKPFISGYTVTGGQKMFIGDSVSYTIVTEISVPN